MFAQLVVVVLVLVVVVRWMMVAFVCNVAVLITASPPRHNTLLPTQLPSENPHHTVLSVCVSNSKVSLALLLKSHIYCSRCGSTRDACAMPSCVFVDVFVGLLSECASVPVSTHIRHVTPSPSPAQRQQQKVWCVPHECVDCERGFV